MGKNRGLEINPKNQRKENPILLNLPEATNSFHITRHLIIIHAKTCFNAHSEKEPTHLVLAFGFSKKLLYSIHSLLEALTLVNLYHFLFVRVIRLQLLHFDPSTWNKKKKLVIFSKPQLSKSSCFEEHTVTLSSPALLMTTAQTHFLSRNWRAAITEFIENFLLALLLLLKFYVLSS